jgi:TonB family protein
MIGMRKVFSLIAIALVSFAGLAIAQSSTASGSERKVNSRVAPNYPELAKKMHIQGIVKIEAVVRPNGSVKSTRVLGGNPVLVDAAADAVSKWKFETGQSETTEVVQLTFVPQS